MVSPLESRVPAAVPQRRVQFITDINIAEIHAGVVAHAKAAGWALFDGKCYYPYSKREEECDGVVAVVARPETARALEALDCPVVRLLCSEEGASFPTVEVDCQATGEMGARHLLSLGTLNCGMYRISPSEETNRMWKGFAAEFASAGRIARLLDSSEGLGEPDPENSPRSDRWRWLAGELTKLGRPAALMVEDDRFVDDVFEAAALLGWRIPEDLAVLGVDNRALILGKLPITVSSVDTNLTGLGRAGAALLDHLMRGGKPPAAPWRIPPVQVVKRESTATFVSGHLGVDRVVNHLRTHFASPLRLPELAKSAGLSVRSLQTAFKAEVGHTLSEELVHLRLVESLRLLRETDLKLESVAVECGFGSARYLCRVFRSKLGDTPTGYRERHREDGGVQVPSPEDSVFLDRFAR
ncbi:MAG: substrate-binding domain-containing protein [Luteolibacter sp.]